VSGIPLNNELQLSSVAARELPAAHGGITPKAAAPGVCLLRHAQLCHVAEGVLAQAVAWETRQVLQVGATRSILKWARCYMLARPKAHEQIRGQDDVTECGCLKSRTCFWKGRVVLGFDMC